VPRSFAITKIQTPRNRPGLVERARLEQALAEALASARLVLISAPAGFGKTTLLTQQIARLEPSTALAWIAADEDDDLARLAACCVAALEPYDLPWRTSPDAVVAALDGASAQRRKELAGEFINTLVATEVSRGLIVIDDAHRIQDPTVFSFLDHVVERLPAHWGIVIATRVDPPMALARLRARAELAEFRQDELRFTRDEVEALVGAGAAAGAHADAAQLLQRTQGWAAGLGLALSTRRTVGALTERHVFDYLAAEVLAGMPEELRRFLLRCSVLPELQAERCAVVCGDRRAGQWLAEVERRGLFVSLRGSGAEAALCLHDLFRDCLDDLLRREHPDELPMLLERAAATEPDVVRRVHYLLRAGAFELARDVVSESGPAMITGGAIGALGRLLDAFPPAHRSWPGFEMLRGWIGWARWDFESMRRAMHRAARGYEAAGDAPGRRLAEAHEALALNGAYASADAQVLVDRLAAEPVEGAALGILLMARIWVALDRGPMDELAALYGRVLDIVEGEATITDWYKATPTTRFIGVPGMAPVIARYAAGAQAAAGAQTSALSVIASVMRAWNAVWRGDAEQADALLRAAFDDTRWIEQSRSVHTPIQLCSAFAHAMRGDGASASAALRSAAEALGEEPIAERREVVTGLFAMLELRFAAASGDARAIRAAALRLDALPDRRDGVVGAERRLARAYLAAAEGDDARAAAAWRASLPDEALRRSLGLDLEVRLRLAAALARSGAAAEAIGDALAPVLARAARDEHLPALLVGPAVLRELVRAPACARLDAGARAQLGEWLARAERLRQCAPAPAAPQTAPGLAGSPPRARAAAAPAAPNGAPVDAAGAASRAHTLLSERERAVLSRLAAGDSNKVIARAFELSPHTVKRHVANILDKLNVRSRGQAAAWFRAHGG
jgi:LuxR family maltose regulon positive regulatory protein